MTQFPPDIANRYVLLLDPMLGTRIYAPQIDDHRLYPCQQPGGLP